MHGLKAQGNAGERVSPVMYLISFQWPARYFVLWPMDAPLTADGQRFLVDPYGRGGLLLLEEVG